MVWRHPQDSSRTGASPRPRTCTGLLLSAVDPMPSCPNCGQEPICQTTTASHHWPATSTIDPLPSSPEPVVKEIQLKKCSAHRPTQWQRSTCERCCWRGLALSGRQGECESAAVSEGLPCSSPRCRGCLHHLLLPCGASRLRWRPPAAP